MVGSSFFEVSIASIYPETINSSRVKFSIPRELREIFKFNSGQYVTVKFNKDETTYLRTYSICSAINEKFLEIGVKHIENGVFSKFLKEKRSGDKIKLSPPSGNFCLKKKNPKQLLLVAAGSGITPILSIAKSILIENKTTKIILLFSNRTYLDMMFKEDLKDLKDQYLNRISIFNFFTKEKQEVQFLDGRLNKSKIQFLNEKKIIEPNIIDQIFICGPIKMTEEIKLCLSELGFSKAKIKTELFFTKESNQKQKLRKISSTDNTIEILMDGTRKLVQMRAGEDFIDKAGKSGISIPFSCRNGMCATCRCKVKKGKVRMKKNYSLEDWEIEKGFVLSCQLEPLDKHILLDFDII